MCGVCVCVCVRVGGGVWGYVCGVVVVRISDHETISKRHVEKRGMRNGIIMERQI